MQSFSSSVISVMQRLRGKHQELLKEGGGREERTRVVLSAVGQVACGAGGEPAETTAGGNVACVLSEARERLARTTEELKPLELFFRHSTLLDDERGRTQFGCSVRRTNARPEPSECGRSVAR